MWTALWRDLMSQQAASRGPNPAPNLCVVLILWGLRVWFQSSHGPFKASASKHMVCIIKAELVATAFCKKWRVRPDLYSTWFLTETLYHRGRKWESGSTTRFRFRGSHRVALMSAYRISLKCCTRDWAVFSVCTSAFFLVWLKVKQ